MTADSQAAEHVADDQHVWMTHSHSNANLHTILYRSGSPMGISAKDVVGFTQARAHLSELADQVKAGAEKVITRNGESYVALIDSDRLDYYHRLEREHLHLLLLDDAKRGLADIKANRTQPADAAFARRQRKRSKANTAKD